MKAVRWLAVLMTWAAVAAAPAQTPPSDAGDIAGVYEDENFEVGSALILWPDGRFRWLFSYGALDLEGEGRWTREGPGIVRLDSDPPVVAPAFELVGAERDSDPGLLVRLADESRSASAFLEVEAEYADGTRVRERLGEEGYRFAPEPGRTLVAVHLASGPFDLRSPPFPVSPDANVLIFRFVPNDLGRVDFRGQRVRVEPGRLTFAWRDMELRYARTGPPPERQAEAPEPVLEEPAIASGLSRGRIDVRLGEPVAEMEARSTYTLPASTAAGLERATRGPIDLRVRIGERDFDAGRIGGTGVPVLIVSITEQSRRVDSVVFWPHEGLLTLDEALARARAMQSWLQAASADAPRPARTEVDPIPAFSAVGRDGAPGARAEDWGSAARMLADEADGTDAMYLYHLPVGDDHVIVMVQNVRRTASDHCTRPSVDCSQGREWIFNVAAFRDSLLGESLQAGAEEVLEAPPPEE